VGPLTAAYIESIGDLVTKQRAITGFAAGLVGRRVDTMRTLGEITELQQDINALDASRKYRLQQLQSAILDETETPTAEDMRRVDELNQEFLALSDQLHQTNAELRRRKD